MQLYFLKIVDNDIADAHDKYIAVALAVAG